MLLANRKTECNQTKGVLENSSFRCEITAGIISREVKNLGYPASTDADESGDPRVNTTVDAHSWQIYFYDCDKSGPLSDRHCLSFQFFTDNSMPHPVPMYGPPSSGL